jgi:hypothetical protein
MELSVQERVMGWGGREIATQTFSYHRGNEGLDFL